MESGGARPAWIHRPGIVVMLWFGSLLNLDCSGHMRVQRTKILVIAGRRESERKAVVGIERLGSELACRNDGVRNVIVVCPGHGGADLHRHLWRREGEICARHPFGSPAPTSPEAPRRAPTPAPPY